MRGQHRFRSVLPSTGFPLSFQNLAALKERSTTMVPAASRCYRVRAFQGCRQQWASHCKTRITGANVELVFDTRSSCYRRCKSAEKWRRKLVPSRYRLSWSQNSFVTQAHFSPMGRLKGVLRPPLGRSTGHISYPIFSRHHIYAETDSRSHVNVTLDKLLWSMTEYQTMLKAAIDCKKGLFAESP